MAGGGEQRRASVVVEGGRRWRWRRMLRERD
jgi:hypothetical protein